MPLSKVLVLVLVLLVNSSKKEVKIKNYLSYFQSRELPKLHYLRKLFYFKLSEPHFEIWR